MHPAPSLAESFPKTTAHQDRNQYDTCRLERPHSARSQQAHPQDLASSYIVHESNKQPVLSPTERLESLSPVRKDSDPLTATSISEPDDQDAVRSANSATNGFNAESSQSIFSVKDGAEILQNRRASRRRTGPLSAQQREKAALIRKLGACVDCRRRRVACHPNHHNMTWEDAIRKYRSTSPLQDLTSPTHHRTSSNTHRRKSSGESQAMDIDSVALTPKPTPNPAARLSSGEIRIRTPLPSAPRLEKAISMPPIATAPAVLPPVPKFAPLKTTNLEKSVSSMLIPGRAYRYLMAHVLLILWEEDDDDAVNSATDELASVLEKSYGYRCEIVRIPSANLNPSRWLSRLIDDFTGKNDNWDYLKIVYYNGYSFLDHDRDMVLASSQDQTASSTIRWDEIQHKLEEACSDTLVIIDAAYFPSSRMLRQKGVLELLAASTTDDYFRISGRASFTRLLVDQLRTRSFQRGTHPLSVAELHSKLLFSYSEMIQDRHVEHQHHQHHPARPGPLLLPLHVQVSSTSTLPSITLTPVESVQLPSLAATPPFLAKSAYDEDSGGQVSLTLRLHDSTAPNLESWRQWLMMLPEGVRSVKMDDSQLRI